MGGGSGLVKRVRAGPPGALCIFVFVAGVKLTSLAHELGSTPCSVAVFAICHFLAPSLVNFCCRISCSRALGWERDQN